jgi:glyoxylase-like metal-dependent hydrolase (beta-lactamase superfamily II)
MIIHCVPVGPFEMNSYIIGCEKTLEGTIIDAGEEPERLIKVSKKANLKIKFLLNTHAHIDHINSVTVLQKQLSVPFYISQKEDYLIGAIQTQANIFGMQYHGTPKVDKYIDEGEKLELGKLEIDIFHVPGHTKGHLVFVIYSEKSAFAGDCLFAGSIGRTDLPGGDYNTLIRSIKDKLLILPDDYIVYPGHGPSTTIGEEKATNPFLV